MYEPLKRLAAGVLRVPLDPPETPAGSKGSAEVFRASPRYLSYKLLPFWFGVAVELVTLLPVIFGVAVSGNRIALAFVALGALGVVVATFLGYCALRLDYELRYYIVTDRALRIREGAWVLREMTLTHANVQEVSIAQGPLQRLFGIADVVVKTAGGGAAQAQPGGHGHVAMLAGVDDAEGVRDRIRAFLRHKDDGGLGDGAARAAVPVARAGKAGALDVGSPAVLAALRELSSAARALRVAAESSRTGG